MKKEINKAFNIIITGYGGQGVLSLAEIISQAAFKQGYEVKQAELHGLAQRGGSLECHLRMGNKIDSPLIRKGGADLIIALDPFEALASCYYANKNKTIILVTSEILSPEPFKPEKVNNKNILTEIKKYNKTIKVINFDKIISQTKGITSMLNTLVLGYANYQGFLPFKEEYIFRALKEKFGERFFEENEKIFRLAKDLE